MKIKIDTSKIKGFDTLPEDMKKALSEHEIEVADPDYSGYVTKETFDKKASEAAELSKKLKSNMSEAELAAEESKQKFADMENELNALRKEKKIAGYKADYLALGYEEKLALETATALEAGDTAKVFANQKIFIEAQKKQLMSENLNNQPKLTDGNSPTGKTAEQIEMAALRKNFGL